MSQPLVDTHAHLDGDEFEEDLEQVVRRAAEAQVAAIVSCGQNEASSQAALVLARRFAGIVPAVGMHPHLAREAGELAWLKPLASDPRVVAIGEIGLDYHYSFSPHDVQREVFARQLDLAESLGLPVIMHCREAEDDLATILQAHYARARRGVVHCFTGSYEVGARFIDEFDVYLGLGGAITFVNAKALHDAAARLPLERLVLETDCPYMTPAPFRGKRNEPARLTLTCAQLAELRGMSVDDVAAATTANARRLFPKLAPAQA